MSTWDAASILDVHPKATNFTCVGTTQRGLRCRNLILKENRRYAAIVLRDLGRLSFRSQEIEGLLHMLAGLTLCKQWHGNTSWHGCQRGDFVAEWKTKIDEEAMLVASSRTSNSSANAAHVSTRQRSRVIQLPTPESTPPPLVRSERVIQSPSRAQHRVQSPTPQPRAQQIQAQTRSSASQTEQRVSSAHRALQQLPSPPQTPPRRVEPRQTELESSPPSQSRIAILEGAESPVSSTPPRAPLSPASLSASPTSPSSREDALPSAPSTPSPSRDPTPARTTLTPASTPPQPAPTPATAPPQTARTPAATPTPPLTTPRAACRHRAKRHTIPDDCPICHDDLGATQDLVWCKKQCGQNFHRECWDTWMATPGSQRNCTYCRQPWDDVACPCDGESPPVHVEVFVDLWDLPRLVAQEIRLAI